MEYNGKIENIVETKEITIVKVELLDNESEYGAVVISPDKGKNWSIVTVQTHDCIDAIYHDMAKTITSGKFSWCDLLRQYHYVTWLHTISRSVDCVCALHVDAIQNLIKKLYTEYKQD